MGGAASWVQVKKMAKSIRSKSARKNRTERRSAFHEKHESQRLDRLSMKQNSENCATLAPSSESPSHSSTSRDIFMDIDSKSMLTTSSIHLSSRYFVLYLLRL